MAIVANGQATIVDYNDAIVSATEPYPVELDMLWLDSRVTPAIMKRCIAVGPPAVWEIAASHPNNRLTFRYIRDWLDGSTVNSSNQWVEIQAYAPDGTNVAQGKTVTSNLTLTDPSFITNGVTTAGDYASTGASGVDQWVRVDLGQVRDDITHIKVWHQYSDGRTFHGTKTEVSDDGVKWKTLFNSAIGDSYNKEYPETSAGHQVIVNGVGDMLETVSKFSAVYENSYIIKVVSTGAGKQVAGFGLMHEVLDGQPTSQFMVAADRFAIVHPTAPDYSGSVQYSKGSRVNWSGSQYVAHKTPPIGTAPSNSTYWTSNLAPFVIDAQKGVIMNVAWIGDATIESAMIKELAAQKLDVTGLDPSHFLSIVVGNGTIGNARITGQISSDNYAPGVSGWVIDKDSGWAEFKNIKARGDIEASSLTASVVNAIDQLIVNGQSFWLPINTSVPSQELCFFNSGYGTSPNHDFMYANAADNLGAAITMQLLINIIVDINVYFASGLSNYTLSFHSGPSGTKLMDIGTIEQHFSFDGISNSYIYNGSWSSFNIMSPTLRVPVGDDHYFFRMTRTTPAWPGTETAVIRTTGGYFIVTATAR